MKTVHIRFTRNRIQLSIMWIVNLLIQFPILRITPNLIGSWACIRLFESKFTCCPVQLIFLYLLELEFTPISLVKVKPCFAFSRKLWRRNLRLNSVDHIGESVVEIVSTCRFSQDGWVLVIYRLHLSILFSLKTQLNRFS